MSALMSALAKAMADMKGVAHDAQNNEQRYAYTSTEGMVRESRRIMARHGLVFVRVESTATVDREPVEAKTRSGNTYVSEGGWLVSRWSLSHSSGESLPVGPHYFPWATGPGRPRDKAIGAAYTSSLGECLRSILLIDRPDEPECAEGRDDSDEPEPPRQPSKPRPSVADDAPPPAWVVADARLASSLAGRDFDSAAVAAAIASFARSESVPSESGGPNYEVKRRDDGAWSCGCKGFSVHGSCRHVAIAELRHRAKVLGSKWLMASAVERLNEYDKEALRAELNETAAIRANLAPAAGPWVENVNGKRQ